jgi:hypothetical protein
MKSRESEDSGLVSSSSAYFDFHFSGAIIAADSCEVRKSERAGRRKVTVTLTVKKPSGFMPE